MSVWVVSKTDIDALVSVALKWTERGDVARMPEPAASVLKVSRETASEVGTRLWAANHDAFNYGGPRRLCDSETLEEVLAFPEDLVDMKGYGFEELPGTPAPETAVRLAGYYAYQTAGDYWEEVECWQDGEPPFEALFTKSMEWYGLALLGLVRFDQVWIRTPFEAGPDLSALPRYAQVAWGLDESDRDLFLRLA